MKVIVPSLIDDTKLVSSTVSEADYAAWDVATAYVTGNRVIRTTTATHRIYEALQATTGDIPEDNTTEAGVATPKWLDLGSTNRWKMFDNEVGSETTASGSLTVVFNPGYINSLALLELTGDDATLTYEVDGVVIATYTKHLDASPTTSWYTWFFSRKVQLKEWVLTDLPNYRNPKITLTITGATVGCGVVAPGIQHDLGSVEEGATASIMDYSLKNTNSFGRVTIVERGFGKRMEVRALFENTDLSRIYRLLASIRATACVWVGTDEDSLSPLVMYGFYKDFTIEIVYNNLSYCSMQIEGLTQ